MLRTTKGVLGFSFIELMTVVALIAIVASSAAPVASSLFQRHREMVLRENLLVLRRAISGFHANIFDDDNDGEIDEDSHGDENHDGFPGIRRVDDDGDLQVDEDWKGLSPTDRHGMLRSNFDWSVRRDDDEDAVCDEEAYPSDLNDLSMKMPILHKRIPIDPTLRIAVWGTVMLHDPAIPEGARLANNDLDWFFDEDGNGRYTKSTGAEEPIVLSLDATYQVAEDLVLRDVNGFLYPTAPLKRLINEDPRNRYDDDGDGRIDEDPTDLLDIRSQNSQPGLNLTSYSEW